MLKLYGFPVSNYVNMVNFTLLERGIPFEYVLTYPDETEATLIPSPRGLVPYMQTPQGYINESSVILEYLEDAYSDRPLLPKDPQQRAYVRDLMRELELYVELPARACYLEAIFGLPLPEAIKAKARDELLAGISTIKRHARFAPYLAGDTLTLADVVFLYSFDLGALVAQKQFGVNVLAGFPAAAALLQRLNENPHAKAVAARRDADLPSFIEAVRAKYGTPQH